MTATHRMIKYYPHPKNILSIKNKFDFTSLCHHKTRSRSTFLKVKVRKSKIYTSLHTKVIHIAHSVPYVNFYTRIAVRDHPYIKSAYGLGGWVHKIAIFADIQYCIYADIVVGWVQKSPKMC